MIEVKKLYGLFYFNTSINFNEKNTVKLVHDS